MYPKCVVVCFSAYASTTSAPVPIDGVLSTNACPIKMFHLSQFTFLAKKLKCINFLTVIDMIFIVVTELKGFQVPSRL